VTGSLKTLALSAAAGAAAIAGCGGEKAGDAAAVARLQQAGFGLVCVASGELVGDRSTGPTVPIHVLRRGTLVRHDSGRLGRARKVGPGHSRAQRKQVPAL